MKLVKISAPIPGWPLSNQKEPYLKQTPNCLGKWGDYHFFINCDIGHCDYWVIFEQLNKIEACQCPPNNTILITGEPPSIKKYNKDFLSQFGYVITCHTDIVRDNVFNWISGHSWFIDKTYDDLIAMQDIEKTKNFSLITSNKTFTDGHRKRFEFAKRIKNAFPDDIDLFGNGIANFEDKWDVMAPYKYSIIIENLRHNDWITEKLFDSYLAQSFPFYYGAPNASKYFNPQSFIEIDIDNFDDTVNTIKQILSNSDFYQNRLSYILDSKIITLNSYNLFPNIIKFIEFKKIKSDVPKTLVILHPEVNSSVTSDGIGFHKYIYNQLKNLLKQK